MSPEQVRFEKLSKNHSSDPASIERDFITKDYLTQDDVRKYARELFDEMVNQPITDAVFLFDALNTDYLFRLLWKTDSLVAMDVTKADEIQIERALIELRQAIVEEFQHLLSAVDISPDGNKKVHNTFLVLISNPNIQKRNISIAQGMDSLQTVVREPRSSWTSDSEDLANYREALSVYAQLPEHPHILSLKRVDLTKGIIESEKLAFTTLDTRLPKESQEEVITTEQARDDIRILLDCMDGALFLSKYGLMLQDVCPENIGIVSRSSDVDDSGILFDIDGLLKIGTFAIPNLSHKEYVPPEVDFGKSPRVASLQESVFQFGKVLEKIVASLDADSIPVRTLRRIAGDMTCVDPGKRLILLESYRRIREFYEQLV